MHTYILQLNVSSFDCCSAKRVFPAANCRLSLKQSTAIHCSQHKNAQLMYTKECVWDWSIGVNCGRALSRRVITAHTFMNILNTVILLPACLYAPGVWTNTSHDALNAYACASSRTQCKPLLYSWMKMRAVAPSFSDVSDRIYVYILPHNRRIFLYCSAMRVYSVYVRILVSI